MKSKIKWIGISGCVFCVFAFGFLDFEMTVGWIRHWFFRGKGVATNVVGSRQPAGNKNQARICRENLHRIQTAKRKAGQTRGQPIGMVTWEETLRAMYDQPRLSAREINALIPKCPGGGTYSLGTLEEVPRCTLSGQRTLSYEDDHIILD